MHCIFFFLSFAALSHRSLSFFTQLKLLIFFACIENPCEFAASMGFILKVVSSGWKAHGSAAHVSMGRWTFLVNFN